MGFTTPPRPTSKSVFWLLSAAVFLFIVIVIRPLLGFTNAASGAWPSLGDYEAPTKEPYKQTPSSQSEPYTPSKSQPKSWELSSFREAWLATEVGGEFDGSRLEEICNATDWRDDVILHMVQSRGGIGNVRGTILDFLYFAVRTGSSHIILPSYVKRTDSSLDWMDESHGYWPFDNLFDGAWFLATMQLYCPQMAIHRSLDDAPYSATVEGRYDLQRGRTDKADGESVAGVVQHFTEWLAGGPPGYDPAGLNLVTTVATLWNFDMLPSPRLRTTLGRLLRINPEIRNLAATAVYNMRNQGLEKAIDPREQMYEGAYYGLHLRTEKDATTIVHWDEAFGGFEKQTDIHLAKCKELGLRAIYVASGNEEDIVRLAEKAMAYAGIIVHSKKDLLTAPEDAKALEDLSWDQRGALDWEVMARSTFFSGPYMVSPKQPPPLPTLRWDPGTPFSVGAFEIGTTF